MVSVAGLLNVIDGAAAKEVRLELLLVCLLLMKTQGRVLIMTTNRPDTLDAALTRPGHIDHKARFTLATRDQIRHMFERMYQGDAAPGKYHVDVYRRLISCGELSITRSDIKPTTTSLPAARVQIMAEQFADMLLEEVFSPAIFRDIFLRGKQIQRPQ
jgi:chaperone BCS1